MQFRLISWIVLVGAGTRTKQTPPGKDRSVSIFALTSPERNNILSRSRSQEPHLLNVSRRLMAIVLIRAGKRLAASG